MKQFKRWILILCTIPLISSCNWIGLIYDYVDYILLYTVDDYVNLTEEQEDLAKERIAKLVKWHKEVELPKYIQLTKDMEKALEGPVSLEALTEFEQKIVLFQETSITRFCEAIAPVALLLEAEQLESLQNKLTEQREKILKPLGYPLEARRDSRLKTFQKNTETWFGKLTATQLAELRKMTDQLPFWEQERYDNHLKNSTDFFTLLQKPDKTAEEIAIYTSQLWASKLHRSSEYRIKLNIAEKTILQFYRQLIKNTDESQRKTLQGNLDEFAMDLEDILAE